MKKLFVYLMLMVSLVGLSQVKVGKHRATLTLPGRPDSVFYTNTIEEAMEVLRKRTPVVKKYTPLSKDLDLKVIEREFNKLYLNYQDSVFHLKKEYGDFLDSASNCQLNYLLNFKYDSISHIQDNDKFKTSLDRFKYFTEYVTQFNIGEILILTRQGSDECEVAKNFFDRWLKSKGHRKIIDDKRLKFYNFKFGYNKFGSMIGIGVFSKYREMLK